MHRLSLAFVLLVSGCRVSPPAAHLPDTARWEPVEIVLNAEANVANPFLTRFTARVIAPDGTRLEVPGFYDGGQAWKIRIMPHTPGQWSVETDSDLPALRAHRYAFRCTEAASPAQHGRLRVDPDHPRHFIHEDGTRHFMLAYECDWLWALDAADPSLPKTRAFLDLIKSHGFNHIIVTSFSYDTHWHPGTTGPDDFGPPPSSPWEGTHDQPDHTRLHLPYWQHFDHMVRALHERGIVLHLLCKVYNKDVRWPGRTSKSDDIFFRTLLARYSAFPGLIWDFAKEAHNEKNLDYKLDRIRYLREADPFQHLVTVHDDDANYDDGPYPRLLDFRTDQQHTILRKKLLKQRARSDWPLLNAEFGYEHGAGGIADKTYGVAHTPEEFIARAWEVTFAGGYTAYYHTHTAWDVLRPEVDPPGYLLFGRLRQIMEHTRYWELAPVTDSPLEAPWVLQNPGKEYLCLVPPGQQPAPIHMPDDTRQVTVTWYDTLSEKETPPTTIPASSYPPTPPPGFDSSTVVLHITR